MSALRVRHNEKREEEKNNPSPALKRVIILAF